MGAIPQISRIEGQGVSLRPVVVLHPRAAEEGCWYVVRVFIPAFHAETGLSGLDIHLKHRFFVDHVHERGDFVDHGKA